VARSASMHAPLANHVTLTVGFDTVEPGRMFPTIDHVASSKVAGHIRWVLL
jgi:hypothetical protein